MIEEPQADGGLAVTGNLKNADEFDPGKEVYLAVSTARPTLAARTS